MFDLIVNFIHQSVPISNVSTALLKVGRVDNVLQQHGIKMKGIIRTPHRHQVLRAVVLKVLKNNIKIKVSEGVI